MPSMLPGRSNDSCFCCGSRNIRREWGVISSFFARRALLDGPQAVPIIRCNACGTRYFDFTPTQEELSRLYAGYRDEAYFRLRNHFEPWYSRELNESLGGEEEMRQRRNVLRNALVECGIENRFGAVLDHGGDRGQMVLDLSAHVRAVYDISGVPAEEGVQAICLPDLVAHDWDLILCCHVLEHLPDPAAHLRALLALGRTGTHYFFEVPNENFRSIAASGWPIQKLWIDFATKFPWFFRRLDFVSRNFDYRLNFVPPLLFFPLCEHLSFFTVQGLTAFLERQGVEILSAGIRQTGHIAVVARKP
ncbi:methyltransferase domain-containing protein [Acidocella sp. KAb 2-4]|uniref:methyltransferase domain-containing protein n=1 Tax=Acidocella sp. KAb 2-4 TaxID=2885158 RepID=UPI001D077981|nr:methyltransferase domain-containing protein [Acidocella sp. KAb 2-4]MCB5946055.1 class I SAM-dependent methyltransferase [Acidocella sp. KAb 2-4]